MSAGAGGAATTAILSALCDAQEDAGGRVSPQMYEQFRQQAKDEAAEGGD